MVYLSYSITLSLCLLPVYNDLSSDNQGMIVHWMRLVWHKWKRMGDGGLLLLDRSCLINGLYLLLLSSPFFTLCYCVFFFPSSSLFMFSSLFALVTQVKNISRRDEAVEWNYYFFNILNRWTSYWLAPCFLFRTCFLLLVSLDISHVLDFSFLLFFLQLYSLCVSFLYLVDVILVHVASLLGIIFPWNWVAVENIMSCHCQWEKIKLKIKKKRKFVC